MVAKVNSTRVRALKQKLQNKVEQFKSIKNANWRCNRFGRHHWICWSETDYEIGYHFDYMRCDRSGCKWSGLTWVEKEKI